MSVKISGLPPAGSSLSTDLFEVDQSGVSKSVTTAQIATDIVAANKIITNPSAASTDNAIVRFDSTTGQIVQNSSATISDSGLLTVLSVDISGLSSGVVHSDNTGNLTSSLIVNADVDPAAAIVDTKLATIATAGKVSNSATTATSSNTPTAIVSRDGSGNFSAGTITASLTGHASLDLPLTGGTVSGGLTLSSLSTGVVHSGSGGALTSSTIVNADVDAAAGIVDTKLATISTAGKVSNSATTATSANTPSAIVARDGSGNISIHQVTLAVDGSNAMDAVTFQQLNSVAGGLVVKTACVAGTTANLTATYANGASGVGATLTNSGTQAAFALDGISLALNDRVLIKNQSTTFQNGIYTVTTVGTVSTNWVLTRATDYDQAAEITAGSLVVVNTGTVNANSSWIQTATVATIGTSPVLFSQFTANPTSFLLKANNLSDLANTTTAISNLGLNAGTATLSVGGLTATSFTDSGLSTGVVHSGSGGAFTSSTIVNADVDAAAGILDTKLATISTAGKVSNSATTATSANTASAIVARDGSGNFSAGTITATVTGHSSLDLPLTGGSLTGALTINPATNQLVLGGVAAGNTTTITSPAPASSRTYTVPDAGGAASFVMTAGNQTIGGTKTFSNTLVLNSLSTGVLHSDVSGNISSTTIVNADISASAGITDGRLATISTAGKVSNSATTAASANTASAIVARDGSGNFAAGTITASLTGSASLNLLKTNNLSDMSAPLQNTQIGFGNSSNAMIGSNSYTWDDTTQTHTIGNSSAIVNTALHLQSTRDVTHWLEADTGNEGTEGSNPLIMFSQDANNTACTIGYDSDNIFRINKNGIGSNNDFIITVGATLSGGGTPGTMPTLSGGIDAINIGGSNGKLTLGGQLAIPATTNQMVLGTTNTTTISSTAPASSVTYTIPDAGGAASFVMTAGNQTIAGNKTLSGSTTLSALGTGVVHSGSGGALTSSTIVNADVDAAAAIVDTKLATIATALKVSNSATTAASTNTASAIVARDGSGNFSAGIITASLTGHASSDLALTGGTLTGALTINPTTNQLVLGGVSAGTTTTITSTAPASNRTYTITDAGAAANFVMTEGAQTLNATKTFSSAIPITATTNQLVLGTTNTTTITSPAPSASRTYTLPDFGGAASMVLTNNTVTTIKTGTYTPTIGDGTNNFTMSNANGWYSQSGDTVNFSAWLNWSGKGSATGAMRISLPFSITGAGFYRSSVSFGSTTGLVWTVAGKDVTLIGALVTGSDYVQLSGNPSDGTAGTAILCSACLTAGNVIVSGTYRTT
jgi:hypothetical protein